MHKNNKTTIDTHDKSNVKTLFNFKYSGSINKTTKTLCSRENNEAGKSGGRGEGEVEGKRIKI